MKKILIISVIALIPLIIGAQTPEGDWERIWEMKNGYYRVMKNGLFGIVNANGEILVPCLFEQVFDLTDDNYVKALINRQTGLYHLEMGLIIPVEYDQIWAFEGNLAKVMKNRRYGFINKEGFTVIPVEYNHVWAAENGLIKVMKDNKIGFLNTDGQIVVPVEYQQIWSFDGNLAKVMRNGKMGYINRDGDEIIPAIYEKVWQTENGFIKTVLDNTEFIYNEQGQIVDIAAENINNKPITPEKPKFTESNNDDDIVTKPKTTTQKYVKTKTRNFDGNLSCINLGINGYVNSNFTEKMPQNYQFLDLNLERSWEVSIYPVQHSIALAGSYMGLVTSVGLQFNNYRYNFNNSNALAGNDNAKSWFPAMPDNAMIDKAKMATLFLNVPLMLEFQIPTSKYSKRFYVSGGIVGNMKLNTRTKVIYNDLDIKYKRKQNSDIGLNVFRYSFMARAGYDSIGIFATYSPVSLFKQNKGPELFPYSVGISVNF